ncbi:MAG: hypothetical protein PF904_05955 [Kiritimatiellae bacterium]|jgi:hypothetical protein|nr:hypothetical protein [Kiritimatiellia bacterium]
MAEKVRDFSSDMSGVFALSDIRNLLQTENRDVLYRALNELQNADVLTRFSRGFYITKGFDPLVLSQRLCPESYVSFGNVLAKQLLIGSVPRYRIRAAKVGPKRVYSNNDIRIEHLSLREGLHFGCEVVDGIRMALPEKAVLDTLYFYRRGIRFSFDIYLDVDYSRLNKEIINEFLKKYKNPVFIDFARNLTNA